MIFAKDQKLTNWTTAAYGSLALPLSTIGLPLSIYLAPFYAGELGLPLAVLGLAMVIAATGCLDLSRSDRAVETRVAGPQVVAEPLVVEPQVAAPHAMPVSCPTAVIRSRSR